jgi:glucose/arabinose dehydrogenase
MRINLRHPLLLQASIGLFLAVACAPQDNTSKAAPPSSPVAQVTTEPTRSGQATLSVSAAGLTVPEGFSANVFAEATGKARHMVVRENGDVYVRLRSAEQGHCNVALRDSNQDGVADEKQYFGGSDCGTGMALKEPYLYTSSREKVYRTRLDDQLVPTATPEVVVDQLGEPSTHDARSLTLDNAGFLYVNVGAPSNACQSSDRKKGSPGQDPCPLLKDFAGIYRFKADTLNQTKANGIRFASGIRNAVALDWNTSDQKLYALQHGRDQLHSLYPDTFSVEDNAQKPAEEYAAFSQGDNLGWPYCYYDPQSKQKVLAPEYGGDGKTVGRCADFTQPIIGFPAHYAPNDLLFYRGSAFPEAYQQGAFIAFHGSWNRAPLPQEGYQVVFAKNGKWDIFADGFAGSEALKASGQAQHRPMGLAETPQGDLLVVDSMEGKIWRIFARPQP